MQSELFRFDNFTVQSDQPEGLHVAIIMDGNGRWAARRNLPRVAGHRAGVAAVRRIVEHAPDVGIGCLTLYAFSSDNWRRPAAEVKSIFWLLRAFLRLERTRLRQAGARLEVIGRRDRIPKLLLREIDQAESRDRRRQAASAAGGHRLLFARCHHARCPWRIPLPSPEGTPTASVLRDMLAQELAAESGEVDLLIRTGGEKRLSDFLLWECAYAELWFTDRMWPEFEAADLDAALGEFRQRERRFGGVPASSAALPVGGAR